VVKVCDLLDAEGVLVWSIVELENESEVERDFRRRALVANFHEACRHFG
jgi:hypothetical protein